MHAMYIQMYCLTSISFSEVERFAFMNFLSLQFHFKKYYIPLSISQDLPTKDSSNNI